MELRDLVETSAAVRATRSRKRKIAAIAELLRAAPPESVPSVVAYLSGRLPHGRIGIGFAALSGSRVEPAAASTLTVEDLDATFSAIAADHGPGSQARRLDRLRQLLGRATETEQAFIVALLGGGLRQGALEGVMIEAVAAASEVDPAQVRRAAMVGGDLAEVAAAALRGGAPALDRFRLRVLTPVQPMLAETAEDVSSALERFHPARLEWKLDGVRIQVHRSGPEVAVYTRSLKNITSRVPEIVEIVGDFTESEFILDGEAIVVADAGAPAPFQETMGRFGSSVDDGAARALAPFFFDCLLAGGREHIDEALATRIAALEGVVPPPFRVPGLVTADSEVAAEFLQGALDAGHEGVMVKSLDDPYEAGRRGASWLKVKPAHTLDLVVIAVEWGSGRRRGKLSNLHLGARDEATGEFVMLGKTFKGMTDDMLSWQTQRFLDLETHREGHVVHVRPEQVVEIAFDGVQASSRYPGGVALRFARVKRYRDDKRADEADTIQHIRAIHRGDTHAYR